MSDGTLPASARSQATVGLGQSPEPVRIGPVTRTDIVRYAGAGGDFNPIHHDDEFARSAGMPGVFAMGLLQGGFLGMYAARWLGPTNLRRFGIRFTGQVWPGDVLTLEATVDRVYDEDDERRAACSLTVKRQTGDVVIAGTATARVAP